jgi:hypothetical protein
MFIDHRQRDVLLQARRIDRGSDLADGLAILADRPVGGVRALQGLALDDQADLLAADALFLDAAQCGLADEIGFHVEVHQPVQAKLERVGVDVRIGMIGQHGAFDPPDRRRVARASGRTVRPPP